MKACGAILIFLTQVLLSGTPTSALAQNPYAPFKDTLELANVSLISNGYEIFATVWRPDEGVQLQDSLVEHVDYFQNIFFDFDHGTITYIGEGKHMTDTIVQVYVDPLNPESKKYEVWCYTNERYNICHVDYQNKTVTYDWYFADIDNSGTFRFVNTQFIEY